MSEIHIAPYVGCAIVSSAVWPLLEQQPVNTAARTSLNWYHIGRVLWSIATLAAAAAAADVIVRAVFGFSRTGTVLVACNHLFSLSPVRPRSIIKQRPQ